MGRYRYFQTLNMNKKQIIYTAKKTLATEVKGIKSLSKTFNKNFHYAVNTIFNSKGRIIVTGIGKSAHIGNKIAATLTSTGTPSFFIHATEASHGDLGSIKKNDCIIAISNSFLIEYFFHGSSSTILSKPIFSNFFFSLLCLKFFIIIFFFFFLIFINVLS